MTSEILIAILSLTGTLIGSLSGIIASNRLISYRLEQLEKKVESHSGIITRLTLLENSFKTLKEGYVVKNYLPHSQRKDDYEYDYENQTVN